MTLKRAILVISLFYSILPGCSTGAHAERETDAAVASATFAVHCYDVGKSALRALKGVREVRSGWHGREEVNYVRFKPAEVRVAQMEEALRKAGTFIRVVKAPPTPG